MRNLCLFCCICLLAITSACSSDPASSTSTEPAAAPEKASGTTASEKVDNLTYIPGKRFGKITGATKKEDLKALYGEQVVPVEIHIGEGFTTPGYKLFPGTGNEAEIIFPSDDNGYEELTVIIRDEESNWQIPGSLLAIGISLGHLGKINGKPITFLGYEWDYEGRVVNWNGGALEGLGVRLSSPRVPEGKSLPAEIVGDSEISSSNPVLEGMDIEVREITLSLTP